MAAPLVERLVAKIRDCSDEESRALTIAELACYWARIGEFDEAERLKSDLRDAYGSGRSAHVSIMIMCLEALLLYYKNLSVDSRDRMLRAKLLSKSFKIARLTALTSAWMAHIDFNQNRLGEMIVNLVDCFESISADDGTALCRAALVLGDAFLFIDDETTSKQWYDKAHRAAVRLGDQAAIGAITYNRAALHVSMARFRSLTNTILADELTRMNTEVQTAINYQAVARLKSLDHLLGTARVGVLMLGEQFSVAATEIEKLLADPSIDRTSSQWHLLVADISFIRARSGIFAGLSEWCDSVPDTARKMLNSDDRAILLHIASKVAMLLGQEAQSIHLAERASDEIEEHCSSVLSWRNGLDRFRQTGLFQQ